jgi:hypothetical protein
MIDHVGFPVSDYERSKAFYSAVLAPLGYALVMEVQQDENDSPAAGFGADGKPDFWIGGEGGLSRALHVAIAVTERRTVDAFHRGNGRWCAGQWRSWPAPALPSQLLCRLRAGSRRAQYRGRLSRAVMTTTGTPSASRR